MTRYTVKNASGLPIWWRDGLWTSDEVKPGEVRVIESDHNANVTMWAKLDNGSDFEWGRVWIMTGCKLTVHGPRHWTLEPN